MKSPEYVACVTRIYRKYIDLAYSTKPYIIDKSDRNCLALAFNRGGFSDGHLTKNKNLVFKDKPNNMGLHLGLIKKYDSKKGLITLQLKQNISIGDSISVQKEQNLYTISELMKNNINVKKASIRDIVTIGRMKGNINVGDKIYKITDKAYNLELKASFNESSELKKIPLNAKISLKLDKPIVLNISNNSNIDIYKNLEVSVSSKIKPEIAKSHSITKEQVLSQISKIQNTPYEFSNIEVDLESGLFLPISTLNELKREAIKKVQEFALSNIQRKSIDCDINLDIRKNTKPNKAISVLLNILDLNKDYSKLEGVDNIYIPLKYFIDTNYFDILHTLEGQFNLFVYLPIIMRNNYNKLFRSNIENIVKTFNIKGFVISNISGLYLINDIKTKFEQSFNFVGNYSLNVYNCNTANNLLNLGLDAITISPELDLSGMLQLCDSICNLEIMVYGNIPIMSSNYCLFGRTNKCNGDCVHNGSMQSTPTLCNLNSNFYLKDRMNFDFRAVPDNIDTVTTIYNSKITSIPPKDFNASSFRVDILDESIDEINFIISNVKLGNKLDGKDYTNGNLNREI